MIEGAPKASVPEVRQTKSLEQQKQERVEELAGAIKRALELPEGTDMDSEEAKQHIIGDIKVPPLDETVGPKDQTPWEKEEKLRQKEIAERVLKAVKIALGSPSESE